jgi:phosphomannomutase
VVDLTPELVTDHVQAFVQSCPTGGVVHLGWDLRASSPAIAAMVSDALQAAGCDVVSHGTLPTPALALASMAQGHGAIMVTGSHIPADRNGLKFYVPEGEITKAQEAAILAALGQAPATAAPMGRATQAAGALADFAARYVTAYGPQALAGLRIGVYQHSSVARDLLPDVLAALGAIPVPLGHSDHFIPVDTEAVDPATRAQLVQWSREHRLDALVSTDGDADRPLMTDATGRVIPGDVLGALSAQALRAQIVCTPVSSNSLIEQMGLEVLRTRIGSPYVIAAMTEHPGAAVVGYEPNGGFLLGFAAAGPAGPLPPLMTRDFLLPVVAPLAMAQARGLSLAALWDSLPRRFTAADRIKDVPTQATQALLAELTADPAARAAFFAQMPEEQDIDLTDGLRLRFVNGEVVHLRPSGNAPECRCYAEADSPERAVALVQQHLERLQAALLA